MITIQWTIKKGLTTPAIGRVRFWLPKVLSDDAAIYGAPEPGTWLALDIDGMGSVSIPDPRQEGIDPQFWAPLVEVDTDAWQATPYPITIPEDETGPFELQFLSPIVTDLALGVVQIRGPRGLPGATGAQGPVGASGAAGSPGTPGTPGTNGSNGAAGAQGPPGAAGPAGADGTLKAYGAKNGVLGTFGPCGDSGTIVMCPVAYRSEPVPAEVGDVLRWSPAFYHNTTQDSVGDLASVVDGVAVRYLSSGTDTPLASMHAGLYLNADGARALRTLDWVVQAADLDEGSVTLAFMYRTNGSGNTMGHGALPGQVAVVNLGQGAGA